MLVGTGCSGVCDQTSATSTTVMLNKTNHPWIHQCELLVVRGCQVRDRTSRETACPMAINGAQLRARVEKSLLDGVIGQRAKQQGKDGCQASPFSSPLSFPFLDHIDVLESDGY